MRSRALGVLFLAAQAMSWTVAAAAAFAQDKPPATADSAQRQVIAAVPRDWPPQYSLDANGNPAGFAIDVMNAIAARAGVRVTYRVVDNFAAANEAMLTGQADVIPNSGITPERVERYPFTSPVQASIISIIVRSGTSGIDDLGDLAGRPVGIVEASVGNQIIAPFESVHRVIYGDTASALFGLLSGRVDAIIYARSVVAALARRAGVEDRIKVVGKPLKEIKRGIAVREDRPDLLAALDKVVDEFVDTPEYRRIYAKWYGKQEPYWTGRRVAWAAAGALAALLIVFALIRYRLMMRMNRRIAASEEKFRDLVEGAVQGVLIHRNFKPLFVNRSYARIFGYDSPDELLRQSALDHVAPHERARLRSYTAARLAGGKAPATYEFQGARRDGTPIWLENRACVVDWEGAPAVQRTVVDVTEKRQAEAEAMLRSSQQAVVVELGQRALMEQGLTALLNTAVTLVTKILDADFGKFLELLPKGEALILRAGVGWTPGLVGRATVAPDRNSQAGFTLINREPVVVADLGKETRFRGPSLLVDHGVVSGVSVVVGEPDRPYGVLAVHSKTANAFAEDDALFLKTVAVMMESAISRKRAGDALRAGEERLRGALESLQEGFALYDSDDRLVAINHVYRRLSPRSGEFLKRNATFEEILRTNVADGWIVEARGREEAFIHERLARHRNPHGTIVRQHADGGWYMIKETGTPEGGTAITLTDISELKRTEDALRESDDRLRGAIESLQEGFALFDADDRLVMVNDVYRRINPNAQVLMDKGATFEEVIRANVRNGMLADAVGREEEFIRERLAQHREPKGPIIRRHSNGNWYILKETRTPEGGIALTFSDVTELKRTEDALRESREQFRAVIEASPSAITLRDPDGRLLLVNQAFADWMAARPEELVGKTLKELFPAYHEKFMEQDKQVLSEGEIMTEEATVQYGDGRQRDVLVTKGPVRSADGDIVAVCAIVTDVTEVKRADKALRETQQRFQIVVDNMPMAINLKDPDGRFVLVGRKYEEWYGVPAGTSIGKRPEEAWDGLKPSSARRNDHQKRVIDTKTVITREDKMPHADGKVYDKEITKFPILDADGDVALIGTIATDVTKRKRAEEAFRRSEAQFRAVVDHSPTKIHIKDIEGRYTLINKETERLFGVTDAEGRGKTSHDLFPKAQADAFTAHDRAVIEARRAIEQEETFTVNGEEHTYLTVKFPIFEGDRVVAVGAIGTDISKRKQEGHKLAELRAELAHVSRVSTMGEMAAGLAHELNQPLTAITNYAKGTLRRLHAGGDSVNLLPIMELVAEQALRAGEIIRKIRGFMNRAEPKKAPVDLCKAIDEVMSLMAGEVHMSGIEVGIDLPKSLPAVSADSIQIQQVLLNLIRNAIAAMDNGDADIHRLEIGARAHGAGDVEVYVRDNGPGIPPDVEERLFEPFFTTKTDGLGMGLSISRSIIVGHQGRIWVNSDKDKGTSFHFTLPISEGVEHDAA